jgi:hypothetical protein
MSKMTTFVYLRRTVETKVRVCLRLGVFPVGRSILFFQHFFHSSNPKNVHTENKKEEQVPRLLVAPRGG